MATVQRPNRPTMRQLEVLRLAGLGHTAAETSQIMAVAVVTVHRHSADVRALLDARNTAHAIVIAISHGFLIFGDDGLPVIAEFGEILTTA